MSSENSSPINPLSSNNLLALLPWESFLSLNNLPLVEAAVWYARTFGWYVFPLQPNSKKPFPGWSWVKGATNDPEVIRQLWANYPTANIGLACGEASRVNILDVDMKGGSDGLQSYQAIAREAYTGPIQRTPSGGFHYPMVYVPGFINFTRQGEFGGLDMRTDGGYVAMTPSVVDGKQYQWTRTGDIPEMAHLLRAECWKLSEGDGAVCVDAPEVPEGLVDWRTLNLDPKYQAYLERCDVSPWRSESEAIFATAGALMRRLNDAGMVYGTMMNNEHVWLCAERHAESTGDPAGWLWKYGIGKMVKQAQRPDVTEVFKPVGTQPLPAPPSAPEQPPFKLMAIDAILRDLKPTQWVVKHYFPWDILGMLWGDTDVYKSFLALDLCLCVATGTPWHGHPVMQGPTLYICGEGHLGIAKRVAAWFQAHGLEPKDVPFAKSEVAADFCNQASTQKVHEAVQAFAAQHGAQPVLIVIDTLARNFGPGNENDSGDMNQFINNVDAACRHHTRAGVIVVHHTGQHVKDRATGSYKLPAGVDVSYSMIRVTEGKKKGDRVVELKSHKVKDDKRPPTMIFKADSVTLPNLLEGEFVDSLVMRKLAETPAEVEALKAQEEALMAQQHALQLAQEWLAQNEVILKENGGNRIGLTVTDSGPELPEDAIPWAALKERAQQTWDLKSTAVQNRLLGCLPMAGIHGELPSPATVTLDNVRYQLWLSRIPPERRNGTLLVHMKAISV